jgi:TPR repeat protein
MVATLDLSEDKKTGFIENSDGNIKKIKHLSEYELLANKGYVDAQFQLGEMYQNGRHVTHDFALSIRWYKKAAEQGHVEAQYNLGVIYKKGRGVPIDCTEAFRWYEKAAEQGMPQAQNNLACLYFYGQGVEVNFEKALYWYKKAAGQETAKSQYNLGIIYQKGLGVEPNIDEGLRWYQKAAKKGYTEAIKKINVLTNNNPQAVLAESALEPTVGFDIDNSIEYTDATESWLKEIVEQVSKVSELKEEEAMVSEPEAVMEVVEVNETDAPADEVEVEVEFPAPVDEVYVQEPVTEVSWFMEAAEKGDAEAQYSLAVMYEYGLLVKQDYMESIFWYKKAANQGYAEAQNQLGGMYQNGVAVKKDLVESYSWFALAKQSSKFSGIDLVAMEQAMTGEQVLQAKLKVAELSPMSVGLV